MEEQSISKWSIAFGISFSITCLLSALLVVLKESHDATVLAWMKSVTGHHWITHGLFNIVLFIILGWILSRMNSGKGIMVSSTRLILFVIGSIIISGSIIAGYYLIS